MNVSKQWTRLRDLLAEAGVSIPNNAFDDALAVLLELSKRYRDPPIFFLKEGRLSCAGVELNAQRFARSLCCSLESRGQITGLTFNSAAQTATLRIAYRTGKEEAKKTMRYQRLEWADALAIGGTPGQIFYATPEWRQLRYTVLRLRGNRCECCGRGPKQGACLHVDHIRPRSTHPELALHARNLQILCEDCNLGKSNRDSTDWRADESEETAS